jgi:hypothetical protein
MARPRIHLEPCVAVHVRLAESTIAQLDRMVAAMQAGTNAKVCRTDALRRILDEHFQTRTAADSADNSDPRL